MNPVLFYTMFCKCCKEMKSFRLMEKDMIGGFKYDKKHPDIIPANGWLGILNHLHLNCHSCNNYDIFIEFAKCEIYDRMRDGYGELDGKKPILTLEWRKKNDS